MNKTEVRTTSEVNNLSVSPRIYHRRAVLITRAASDNSASCSWFPN
jgi:hypothetical protein